MPMHSFRFFLLVPLLFVGLISTAWGQEKAHVLLLNSYHYGLDWTDDETKGVREVLEKSGRAIELHVEYMDSKRLADEVHFRNLHKLLEYKYRNTRFAAILVADNDAFNFLRQYRNDPVFANVPVIFAGVNFFHKEMLAGISGFTGVAETFEGGQTIGIMQRLHPGVRRIVVVIDATTTGEAIRKDLEPMLAPYTGQINFEFWDKLSLDQLRARLPSLDKGTLVLLMPYARDYLGTFITYPDLATMVSQHSSVPVYGTYDFYMGYGIVGGRLTSGEAQGRAAADILLRVLGGEDPNRIPVITVAPSEFQFDSRLLHKYGIATSELPAGSRILFQTWYELYRTWVWLAGLLVSVTLILGWGLVRSYMLKRRSDVALKQSKEQLEAILNSTSESIFHVDRNGIILAINDIAAHRVQQEPQAMIGKSAFDFFPPEVAASRREILAEVFRTGKVKHTEDARNDHFFSLNYYPIVDHDGKVDSVVVYAAEISERKQMEVALQQQLLFSNALNAISRTVVEQDDPDSILDETVHIVGETLGADRALIYDISFGKLQIIGLSQWLNPNYSDIISTKATYPLDVFIEAVTELRRTKTWFTSHSDNINPHLIKDGSGDRLHNKMMIKSLLWYPFAFQKDGFYLLVLNQTHKHKEWTKEEINFLDSVSQLVNVELDKILLTSERQKNETELRIAAIAFESQEGMLITDANKDILRVNKAFTSITGYTIQDVIGLNPRILSSGRQDDDFYRTMWQSINANGAWDGEIWNRRKNGEIYPEHLTITAVKDQGGNVTNYVAALADITQSKTAEEEIKNLAFYDPLTGLPNRRLLQDRLKQALASSGRSGRKGALLFIDLDNFKALNDTLGHDIGDLLLQQVAQRLSPCVREGDTVARLGGDEFVVMLEDLSKDALESAAQTEAVGEKILATLNQPYQLGPQEHHSTSSIGASLFTDHQQPIEDLLKQADIAMYQAKKAGRNTLRFFDPQMQDTINIRAALEGDLRKALEQQQFHLYFQTQVDSSLRLVGAEALIRWVHPERGLVSPAQFIPLAEDTGLILPIGQWVMETASVQLKEWQNDVRTRDLVLSVNVSAKQFRQPDFVNQVQAAVRRHAIDPKLLKLELTESMLLENIEDTIATMSTLKGVGVQFSLDDFGTGYSSLQYLKRLPLNQLKIDQSFVRDIATDNSDKAIVRTVIAMARGLNLDVIAEGVETEEQRQFLLDEGCEHFQGYLFSKPVPIEQFEALLKQN